METLRNLTNVLVLTFICPSLIRRGDQHACVCSTRIDETLAEAVTNMLESMRSMSWSPLSQSRTGTSFAK